MSTPPQPTPGDAREDHAQAVGDTVGAIVDGLELALIAAVAELARKTAAGVLAGWAAQRQFDRTAAVLLDRAVPHIRTALDHGVSGTVRGVRRQVLATAGREAALNVTTPDISALTAALDAAVDTAVATAQDALSTAITAADTVEPVERLTPHQEAVQRAIEGTRGGMPGGSLSLSRIQAAQKALDDLADRGITGFVDRTGRRWDLTSYVEMATRTAVSNAWDDMQAGAMVRSGLDLVLVATHSTEGSCPHCLPWLGRTLSLTGETDGYPTIAEAKGSGFRHPNCRCFWTPIGAGLAMDVTNPVPLDEAAAVYKASQRQRALERKVREAGRRAHAAITPQARARARRDLAAARAASAAHRQRTGLRMTRASVRRREHPHRAH